MTGRFAGRHLVDRAGGRCGSRRRACTMYRTRCSRWLSLTGWVLSGTSSSTLWQPIPVWSGVLRSVQCLVGRLVGNLRQRALSSLMTMGIIPPRFARRWPRLRARYGTRPLWAVFQPHTYSRLQALWGDFGGSLADADHVIVLDVYAAREEDPARRFGGVRPCVGPG